MRYLKVLLIAVFFFLAMIFLFQNQQPLSQQTELGLNLFFIPPMHTISMPFYFIVIAAFLLGCVLTWLMLLWDKLSSGTRLMKSKMQVSSLQKNVARLTDQLDKANAKAVSAQPPVPVDEAQAKVKK